MNISGIWKNNIDYIICKAEIETQTQRTNVWIPRGKVGGGVDWRLDDTCELLKLRIKQIVNQNAL